MMMFRNVEATLGGKSDPYMRVQINNVTKGRTDVINNSMWSIVILSYQSDACTADLNPEWDQILYIPGI
jgi:Ca2+-dependent lipid-binding protein